MIKEMKTQETIGHKGFQTKCFTFTTVRETLFILLSLKRSVYSNF